MMPIKIDRAMKLQALRLLQAETGGKIQGLRLLPVEEVLMRLSSLKDEPITFNRQSFLVATAPQQEMAVTKALRDAGLDAYCPVEPKSVRVNGIRRRTIERPMMPGYVFPIFDVHRDHWQIIPGIRGVLRLFMINLRPVPLPEAAIQRIHDREVEAKMRGKPVKSAPYIAQPGQWVQIDDGGPWNGLLAEVGDLLAGGRRIALTLELFGRLTPVEVSVNSVRAI